MLQIQEVPSRGARESLVDSEIMMGGEKEKQNKNKIKKKKIWESH
jgi:hypothetical protein